jgi:hypothetical protein
MVEMRSQNEDESLSPVGNDVFQRWRCGTLRVARNRARSYITSRRTLLEYYCSSTTSIYLQANIEHISHTQFLNTQIHQLHPKNFITTLKMGSSVSKAGKIPPTLSPDTPQNLVPQRFIATYVKSWKKLAIHISEPDQEPQYIVDFPLGAYGDMVMFNGPTTEHAPLANAKPEGKWGAHFKITLPEMDGRPRHEEILRYKCNFKTERYWFAMEVGDGPSRHIEKFEWRRSHSQEVASLGGGKWGWKLVRSGSDDAEAEVPEKEGEDRHDGLTSDGKEIVAVWADPKLKKSLSTVGEFEFRGSGASGELGRGWALMALLTRMCMWQKEYQATITASAA